MRQRRGYRAALLALTCLLVCTTSGGCLPSQAQPGSRGSSVATESAAPGAAAASTPASSPTPVPPLVPDIPSSAESFEDLVQMFDYDAQAPLDLDMGPGGVTVHDISYASPAGGRVTAYLVEPPGEGPFAGMVLMHGGGGSRLDFIIDAFTLAGMGAVSVMIDAPTSRPEPWHRVADPYTPEVNRDIEIQNVVDLRRAVDLLVSRPDVDPERIGFVGHSYGAITGGVLASVEHRIKAYVLMAAYPRYADTLPPSYRVPEYVEGMSPLDPIQYIDHAAPSALFFQFGLQDGSLPLPVAQEYVEQASLPKLAAWYPTGHDVGEQAFDDRLEWLAAQLDLWDTADSDQPSESEIPGLGAPPEPRAASATPSPDASYEALLSMLDYDAQAPLDVDLGRGGVTFHDISYASPMGGRVTAYMLVPPGEGPFPGVVFMHGGGGDRSNFLRTAMLATQMGAVSLLIDGVTARPEPWRREPDPSDHTVLRDIHIQTIIDLRRAVDVLISRADVDPERLAFMGHSYGGILGGVLAGVDHRIGSFLLMSGYPRFIETLPLELRQEEYAQVMDPVDPIHYIGHAAPSTLFFQFGRFDSTMLPMAPLEYFDAASEPKEVRWYDAGHGLNSQAYYDRGEWLATQLGLDPSPLESISVED